MSWNFNSTTASTCTTSGPACSLPRPQAHATTIGPTYSRGGVTGTALQITPDSGGYEVSFLQGVNKPVNGAYPYGFAWTAFVNPAQLGTKQAILWHEGGDGGTYYAGFSIAINANGQVAATVGHQGSWVITLTSQSYLAPGTWHNVALVWDTKTYYLMVDGVYQASAAGAFPPDEDPNVGRIPVTMGSYWAGGKPRYVLTNGQIDDVRFILFTPQTFHPSTLANLGAMDNTTNNFILAETGLMLRLQVLTDLVAQGIIAPSYAAYDQFKSATMQSTSILRAWINSFYATARRDLTRDSLPGITEATVYPLNGYPTTPAPYSGYNSAQNSGNATLSATSMYLRVRDAYTTTFCEGAGILLRGIYKAFGYQARSLGWIGPPNDWTDASAHYLNEVWLTDVGQYVMQDPTYNLFGYNVETGTYVTAEALYGLAKSAPASLPFTSSYPGNASCCDYNPSPIVPRPPAALYFNYFDTVWRAVDAMDP